MLKKPEPKQPEDEITQKLRAAARKRRPLTWQGVLVLLALFLVPAGLLMWSMLSPRPDPPRLDVVAFDQLGLAGQEIELRAILEPMEVDREQVNLAGFPLFFEENLAAGKAKAGRVKEAASVDGGLATVSWSFPDGSKNTFVVRVPGDKVRRGAIDRGQIYPLSSDTPLMLVDVTTLSAAVAREWQTRNPMDIRPLAEAAKALQTMQKKKIQVVYLALAADRPLTYRKVRGWVENQVNGKNPFPAGPVLGRKEYVADGESAARHETLRGLKENFRGLMVAIVGQGEAAAVCRGLGVDTILFGADAAPEDVIRVKSWKEVPAKVTRR
jgi:hypothetical protein